ncbi:MAG TPA: homoserine dehydrogenase [Vicinamibacterales bacterium]|nr:homoserine dehydrogenase [Vicinamibacterales bacterium]
MSAQSVEWEIDRELIVTCRPRVIRVGLLGYGRVGQAVAAVADRRRDRLQAANIEICCVKALVRDWDKVRLGPRVAVSTDPAAVLTSRVDVVVEVLGGLEPARTLVSLALDAGIPVVSANKTLVASCGSELRALASRRGTALAFDAAVLAGVPFLGSLSRRPLVADAREIAGVLNGTSNFILSEMAAGSSFEGALEEAMARGYAEPDSAADVSGLDAAQKLAILLQLAGTGGVRAEDLPRSSLDVLDPHDLAVARRLGGAIKPVAFASLDPESGGAWVGPAFLQDGHPLGRLNGVTNGVQLTGWDGHAVTFEGPGAGPEVTAITILDDIAEVVSAPRRFSSWPSSPSLPSFLAETPAGGWFVSLAGDVNLATGHVAEFFAARGVPLVHLLGGRGRLAGLTLPAEWATIQEIVSALCSLGARVIALPVFESDRHE